MLAVAVGFYWPRLYSQFLSHQLSKTRRAGEWDSGRVAQAFELAGITNKVGAPFLRIFCEGAGVGNADAKWV
jgi:hypothetical protein